MDDGVFHNIIPTFDDDVQNPKKKDNRSPEAVYDAAIEAYENYPNKRLIIHFMQPHAPHFSQHAESIRDILREKENIKFTTWDNSQAKADITLKDLNHAARRGYISDNLLGHIYTENLQYVLNYVNNLISQINGKTVVTADHGEHLGESESIMFRDLYDHSQYIYSEELRKVPWLTIDSKNRRDINKDLPDSETKIDEKEVKEQLKLLGYC